jgi:hypothetical protein
MTTIHNDAYSMFLTFDIISNRHFLHMTLCSIRFFLYLTLFPLNVVTVLPFGIMSHSAFIIFNRISSHRLLLFDILCRSAFITYVIISFVVIYHSTFCPFNDFYHLTFSPLTICPRRRFVFGCFLPPAFFYSDILSVNRNTYFFWKIATPSRVNNTFNPYVHAARDLVKFHNYFWMTY